MYRMQVGKVGGKIIWAESTTGTFKKSEVEKVKTAARKTYNQEQEVKTQKQAASGYKQKPTETKKLEDIVETGAKVIGAAGLFGLAIPGAATVALVAQLFKAAKALPPITTEQRARIAKLSKEQRTIAREKRRRLTKDPFKKEAVKEKPFVPKSEAFFAYLRGEKKIGITKPAIAGISPEFVLIQRFLPSGLRKGYL